MIGPNAKTPDVTAEGVTNVCLKCHTCKQVIKIGEKVKIYISYNFYYDHCLFFHMTCEQPKEMYETHNYSSV